MLLLQNSTKSYFSMGDLKLLQLTVVTAGTSVHQYHFFKYFHKVTANKTICWYHTL